MKKGLCVEWREGNFYICESKSILEGQSTENMHVVANMYGQISMDV